MATDIVVGLGAEPQPEVIFDPDFEVDQPMRDTLHETIDQAREIAAALNLAIESAERQRDRELARRIASDQVIETFGSIGGEDLVELRAAKLAKIAADDALAAAVAQARAQGNSWAMIGDELDMTGEGARKRFGN